MLVLAGTPIGRVDDASSRLAETLRTADVIAAEDTRRLRRLLSELGVETAATVVSYFEGNEDKRNEDLLARLRLDETVVLVTDAGMPSISDPGYRIVAAAVAEDLPVTVVPGPSAVLAALAVSGLPVERFSFEGFAPRKEGERAKVFSGLADERRTMVFFESPHRTVATLRAMATAFGVERRACVCRELTKTYEEVRRGTLDELADWAAAAEHGVRGEITLVVSGAASVRREYAAEELRELVTEAEASGLSRRDAIAQVVEQTGARKRLVYEAAHA